MTTQITDYGMQVSICPCCAAPLARVDVNAEPGKAPHHVLFTFACHAEMWWEENGIGRPARSDMCGDYRLACVDAIDELIEIGEAEQK